MVNYCHHSELEKIENLGQKTWLITGGAGFIGSHLCEALLEYNQKVICFDNLSTGSMDRVSQIQKRHSKGFEFVEGDLASFDSLKKQVDRADFILHQGALGSVPRSIEFPIDTFNSNVLGFHNLLVAASDSRVKTIVYASSSSVYGDSPTLPKVEEGVGKVLSPYALSKSSNESYAEVYSKTYDLPIIGLRYFNVFGPYQNPNGAYAAVIPKWIAKALNGETIEIYGDGKNSRDFCYIDNVVQANLLAALNDFKEESYYKVYNVAVNEQTSLNQLFDIIKEYCEDNNIKLKQDEAFYAPERKGDVKHSLADITKISNELGYLPKVKFKDGIKRTFDWFLKNTT